MRSGNDDLAEIAGKVDKIVRDMQTVREQNRRDFPEGTKALMVVRKVFGESARMVYIEENGRSIGRLP